MFHRYDASLPRKIRPESDRPVGDRSNSSTSLAIPRHGDSRSGDEDVAQDREYRTPQCPLVRRLGQTDAHIPRTARPNEISRPVCHPIEVTQVPGPRADQCWEAVRLRSCLIDSTRMSRMRQQRKSVVQAHRNPSPPRGEKAARVSATDEGASGGMRGCVGAALHSAARPLIRQLR